MTRAIANVIANVIGDNARITRVIFGNAGFDLADEVSADVGAFGKDTATQPGED